jgi:glycine/D-amino acid oxidase-like deaminating enzyme
MARNWRCAIFAVHGKRVRPGNLQPASSPMSKAEPPRTDLNQAPGWYAMLSAPAPAKRLTGQQVADWVVVGAGVTGLAAARRLAELAPQARVVLLEEFRLGYGSSGRNAGFIIDTPHLSEQFDLESNRRISRLVIAGRLELEEHVQKHDIDCEWSPRGHLTAVVERKRVRRLESTCRSLDAIGEKYGWLEGNALADVVGTHHYHAAVYTPRTVLMNPAALCRGLGDTLPDNVEVFEESPVIGVESGSPVRIECAEGSIRAANVLLTTNAFITKLGFLRRDVFPLIACGSLTRELTEEEQGVMGGALDWGITGIATVRRTLSNRMLFRHSTYYRDDFRLTPKLRAELLATHVQGLRKRFPMLSKLEFEYTWAGVFCMTRNGASYFGRLERGIFASLGYSGVGVPRGTISGKLLAEYAMGSESDLISDVETLSGPPRLPPKPLLDVGVRARLAWHRWQNRAE